MMSRKVYVVGTRENYLIAAQARTVYSKTRDAREIRIHRSGYDNVAGDVNLGLRSLSLELAPYRKITIDDDAWVEVSKAAGRVEIQDEPRMIEAGEFMMIPFKNYMGIVLLCKLLVETDEKLFYKANVIDPIEDYNFFDPAISI